MRPIKFRAWDKEKKMMAYDVQNEYDTIAGVRYWKDGKETDEEPGHSSFGSYLDDEYWTVMQFTGLLDKNGKEIYEGDIIVYEKASFDPSEGEDPAAIEEVKWGEGCFITGTYELWELTGDAGVEVLGNIYENPELLK